MRSSGSPARVVSGPSPDERTTVSRHRISGSNAARNIIEYALEQSHSPRGAHRSVDNPILSPRRITLTALVAGAVTMSSTGMATAAVPTDHTEQGSTPQSAGVSHQIHAAKQNSGEASSSKTGPTEQNGVLQTGSQGDRVNELQRVLNAWYPSLTSLEEDGDYGKQTADRVSHLQERAGLEVDGIAGPETLSTLHMIAAVGGATQQPADSGDDGAAEDSASDDSTPEEGPDEDNAAPADTPDDGDVDEAPAPGPAEEPDEGNPAPTAPDVATEPSGVVANQQTAPPEEASDDVSDDAPDAEPSDESGDVVSPTTGQVTQPFSGGGHAGVDIADDLGTPIHATTSGEVVDAGPADGFGQWVRVQHDDDTISVYGHINEALVSQGQHVDTGQQIATMGNRGQSTGPHLHFEISQDGGQNVDPQGWLSEHGASL